MHRRRKYWIVFVMLAMIVLCCGCGKSDLETSQSYTYDVATGDKIKITFQTKGGYVISPDTPFVISKDGNKSGDIYFQSGLYGICCFHRVSKFSGFA